MTHSANQKALCAYYKAVEKSCPRPVRKRLSADLKESVSDFLVDNKNATIDDIKSHFGEPAQFSSEYIESVDDSLRLSLFEKAKKAKRNIIIATVSLILVMIALTTVYLIHDWKEHTHYYTIKIIDYGWIEEE